MPVLDWVSYHDPESLHYATRPIFAGVKRTRKLWTPGQVLDQGQEGACVGFGVTGEMIASPVRVDLSKSKLPEGWPTDPQRFAFYFYDYCRAHDSFPGVTHEGTSVHAGMQTAKMLGLIKEYRWALGIEDVIDALMRGPVVLGIPWPSGMYSAPGGEVVVQGQVVGGHCILAIGYDPDHLFADGTRGPAILLLNSWGPDWGRDGVAWIKVDSLGLLLKRRGEAAVPLRRSYGRYGKVAA